jgi:RNA polymerase sigma factor (sigma-70 family)
MNNNEKFNEVYTTYYKFMLNYAKQYMNRSYTEDVVHDAFFKLIKSPKWSGRIISISDDPDKVRAILASFICNECKYFNRHAQYTNKIFTEMPDYEIGIVINPEQEYQNHDIVALLMVKIYKLNEPNKSIYQYYIERYSMQEIAEKIGFTSRAIESRIYRITNDLKKIIGENS